MKHMHKIAMKFWKKAKKFWKKIKIPKKISKNTIMLAVSVVVFLMAIAIIWVATLKIPLLKIEKLRILLEFTTAQVKYYSTHYQTM